jgi:hypothetical protein
VLGVLTVAARTRKPGSGMRAAIEVRVIGAMTAKALGVALEQGLRAKGEYVPSSTASAHVLRHIAVAVAASDRLSSALAPFVIGEDGVWGVLEAFEVVAVTSSAARERGRGIVFGGLRMRYAVAERNQRQDRRCPDAASRFH